MGERGVRGLHALLRRLLPRRFREAHADEMEGVFRERLREARRRNGVVGATRVWLRELWDLGATGARLRADERRSERRERLDGPASRGTKGGGGMRGLRDDFMSALRSLRRSPGFALFAMGTLALGIGATVAFSAFFNRVILHPVDFPGSDRVVMAWRWQAARDLWISPDAATRDRVRKADVFSAVAGVGGGEVAWSTDDGPRVLSSMSMDAALPALAGMPPILGRYFDQEDLAGDGAPVAILSEGLWKRAFGGDPGVLGRTLRIEGEPRTVVGVAPDALRPPGPGRGDVDLWLPLPTDQPEATQNVFARLRDGVTLEHAREVMAALDKGAADAEKSDWGTKLVPVAEMISRPLMSPLKVAGTAVALLLLIACLNVANLLLARGDARTRDTAVRSALGAGRTRLGREMLFESLLIALVASVLGLILAAGAVDAFRAFRPEDLTLLATLRLDPLVTAVAVLVAVGTVMAFGVLPLAHRVRTRPAQALTERAGTAGAGTLAVRRLLMIGEVAHSFALLAGGLQVASALRHAGLRDPGFAVRELVSVRLRLPAWRFADAASKDAALEQIRDRLRKLPGAEDVALAAWAPPKSGIWAGTAESEVLPAPEGKASPTLFFGNAVVPGYFAAVGQAVVQGRAFTAADLQTDPQPYILGETAARKYFPDGNAVGGQFRMGGGAWHTVIGVVRDTWATGSANDPAFPQLYTLAGEGGTNVLLVRTADPVTLAGAVREAVRSVDNEIPVLDVQPVAAQYRQALSRERLLALLLAAFALTAAVLAAAGLYGVVAQIAVRRTREFGIRISLGAERPAIFALALRGGVLPVALGLVLGSGLAWAGLRFFKMGVAGLKEVSPLAFVAAGVLLALATVAAMGVPAMRASRTDAMEALRVE
jgi:putative ABC transport system permease protein